MQQDARTRAKRILEWVRWVFFLWNAPSTACKMAVALVSGGAAMLTWLSGYGHPQILVFAAIGVFWIISSLLGLLARYRRVPAIVTRSFFVACWLITERHARIEFVLELRDDGTACERQKHGPVMQSGKWTCLEGEAQIELAKAPKTRSVILKPNDQDAFYGNCIGMFRPISWLSAHRVS
jgi:hypothetical protein